MIGGGRRLRVKDGPNWGNPNHPKVDDGKVTRKVIIGGHTFSSTLTKPSPRTRDGCGPYPDVNSPQKVTELWAFRDAKVGKP